MLALTPQQFQQRLEKHAQELSKLIQQDLPVIIGKMAVDHFKLNFQNEAWGREKWPDVKRRSKAKYGKRGRALATQKASVSRKILSGDTGQLGRSIQYTPESGKVIIHSDLVYAAVHNYGLKAGRGAGFIMPKRQFIGDDPKLNEKVKTEIEKQINKILNL